MEIGAFIDKWRGVKGGAERANYGQFVNDLCQALELPVPGAAEAGVLGDYQFDGPVPNASVRTEKERTGFIDLYKRGHFILEAKQSYLKKGEVEPGIAEGNSYDRLMRGAYAQARNYAANLPGDHPSAPFLIVCDVGRAFELYFDWTDNGRGYEPFPHAQNNRIAIDQLTEKQFQDLFRGIWTNINAVDPRKIAADVSRNVATYLADVSDHLEGRIRHDDSLTPTQRAEQTQEASLFLMRILFCMFAEDVGLLPEGKFTEFLENTLDKDEPFRRQLEGLWISMGQANRQDRYADAVEDAVPYFNGGLFRRATVFPLIKSDREILLRAAKARWTNVEPAIFGTMLEKALGAERDKLGAHYTPRKYVEFLVRHVFVDDLEAEWSAIEDAAQNETAKSVIDRATAFHEKLASLKILDPACGTGNFLYVSMELMLNIEGKLIRLIRELGGKAKQRVDPRQFLGLELNTGAAKITELVLWIGWLRKRMADPEREIPDPVLATLDTVNPGQLDRFDSVVRRHIETLAVEGTDLTQNYLGDPDGENPGTPDWPEADYIVGNPPFTGGKDLKSELGEDYQKALWAANDDVGHSADLVMYWWNKAAKILTAPDTRLKLFGLVSTNSITQEFSRRVIAQHLDKLSLVMAVPDHPWVKLPREEKIKGVKRRGEASLKQAKKAAVRIAMTVAEAGSGKPGRLFEVASASGLDSDNPQIVFHDPAGTLGAINADLSIGADVTRAKALKANEGLSSPGVKLHGDGFIVDPDFARNKLGLGKRPGLEAHIRPYLNGRDLLQRSRGKWVIDLFGLSDTEVMDRFPEVYDHVRAEVYTKKWNPKANKGEGAWEGREVNNRPTYKKNWWVFGEPRSDLRPALAGLPRYIATVETAKHRIFRFLEATTMPDNMLVVIGSDEAFHLGVLSSHIHVQWSLKVGGTLEDRPRYNKSQVFDPFPFPDASDDQRTKIAELAERLDRQRKEALAETPNLTMTEIYNCREKLRKGGDFTRDERDRIAAARARIIDDLHSQLDAAVAQSYGWPADLAPAEIVARLVTLNAERAAEEATGKIRWLRPDYQIPRFGTKKA